MYPPEEHWVLTKDAFERFLAALDPDPNAAGVVYERIRSRLMIFFRCNGCADAELLTDETLDRTIRRLGEIEIRNVMSFVKGIARNVASEAHKKSSKTAAIEDLPAPVWDRSRPDEAPAADPMQLRCLERCLQKLGPDEEKLIRDYYQDEKRQKIDRKRRIAEALGISAGALRIKAFRVRRQLQRCVEGCVRLQTS
jgi:DNA-directed RNA polymerase specialized sigma24 family protein